MTACLLTESWFQCVTILAKQLLAAKTEMQNNSFEQRVHLISSQPPVAFFANARCLCNTKKIQSLQTLLKESTLSHATQQLCCPGRSLACCLRTLLILVFSEMSIPCLVVSTAGDVFQSHLQSFLLWLLNLEPFFSF